MALTDATIKTAKPADKAYKLGDAGGLYLFVTPAGGKLWRLKYRIDNREQKLSFGAYSDVSLADARAKRDEARKQLANNINPTSAKKEALAQSKINYSAASDRVLEQTQLLATFFTFTHFRKLVLNIFSCDFFVCIAYRFYKVTLCP